MAKKPAKKSSSKKTASKPAKKAATKKTASKKTKSATKKAAKKSPAKKAARKMSKTAKKAGLRQPLYMPICVTEHGLELHDRCVSRDEAWDIAIAHQDAHPHQVNIRQCR